MGTRYILTVACPNCGHVDDDVYYAPTCGFVEYQCRCGHTTDLEAYTGISYEDCSNIGLIQDIVDGYENQEDDDDDQLSELVPA